MSQTKSHIAIFFVLALSLVSCQKLSFDEATESGGDGNVTINVTAHTYESFVASRATDEGTKYAMYFFDPSGECIYGYLQPVSPVYDFSYNVGSTTGQYTVASIIGFAYSDKISSSGLTMDKMLDFPKELHNIYLGSATVDVKEGQDEYDVEIWAQRLMADFNVNIENVPSSVSGISITLPNQATQFTMSGEVSGSGKSQTFSLAKGGETSKGSGLYTWSVVDQVIYPSADGCTTMPIDVAVTFSDGTTKKYSDTYKETTPGVTCCTRNTYTTLTLT